MFKQWISHSFVYALLGATCLFSSYENSLMAQKDPYKLRSWDWDYKETWREDRDTFYSGGNQTNAIQKDFRYQRPPGIGDPDDAFWLDPQFYRRPGYDYQRGYDTSYTRYPPYSTYYNYYGYNKTPSYPSNQRWYDQRGYGVSYNRYPAYSNSYNYDSYNKASSYPGNQRWYNDQRFFDQSPTNYNQNSYYYNSY